MSQHHLHNRAGCMRENHSGDAHSQNKFLPYGDYRILYPRGLQISAGIP